MKRRNRELLTASISPTCAVHGIVVQLTRVRDACIQLFVVVELVRITAGAFTLVILAEPVQTVCDLRT